MLKNLKNKKVAVLSGGMSGERAVSLRSGKRVFESLKSQGFKVVQLDPKDGDLTQKLKKQKIDIAFIALHGKYGEDGTIQGLLELAGIPYTGSGVLASALAMNKVAAKYVFRAKGVSTPNFMILEEDNLDQAIGKIKRVFPFPMVVKPFSEGSSLGVSIVKDPDQLEAVARETVKKFKEVFVEEFIAGKEVTVGILGTGQKAEALPILELVSKNDFYDYEAKYTSGMTEFILPARLVKPLYEKTQATAIAAHRALGCRGLSRVDIIVGTDHTPYVHEVNTIPGMTDQSDLPAEAAHAGIGFDELVLRILESAFEK
ncbi:MAG: D-alanine--D-alanine ligase [Candidatus Saganbacteria bacterium]|nr:D-alanine--D-alanine ligase [Candidatus Saganbacteria bacterium]